MDHIKELRLSKKLNLKDVADAVDSDPGNLSRIERGKQTLTIPMAKKLAEFYGVSIDHIVNGHNNSDDEAIA